ncbi:MAG: alpha/beta fold hydrolase [Alphaproteobacteria bacterium]|nr:alpha/beta fold hydrolase [Alphaproteobacteria bacterium]
MSRRIAAILSLDVVGYTARMAADPSATLADLQRVLDDVVRPAVRDCEGRIVKLMGDGALVEFATAANAIAAAESIQRSLKGDSMQLRAGVHAGDVTVKGADIFGEAVNIAARLEAAAPPGGVLVSRTAMDVAGGGLQTVLKPEGALRLKGLPQPVEALSIDIEGDVRQADAARLAASQDIRFATSADGTRLAWTATGEGPLLVKAPNWIQHLEHDWSVALVGWLPQLSAHHRLVRFDARCNGLSDRGVADISLERFVDDLEAVYDAALIERAPVFAYSFGCVVAAAFAARRPDRVSGLVLMSGFVQGMARRDQTRDDGFLTGLRTMSREGWDDDYPSVRDLIAQAFTPEASPDDHRAYAEFMRAAISVEDWLRIGDTLRDIDITDWLSAISCPSLVLHASRERMQGADQSQRLAAGIADARFCGMDSANNLMPVYDPAWPAAMREIESFLGAL